MIWGGAVAPWFGAVLLSVSGALVGERRS
ncbi:MprA protease, GlyGly-CTERM protein-sorting domain-containing form [Streptomyces sp. NPDC058045]